MMSQVGVNGLFLSISIILFLGFWQAFHGVMLLCGTVKSILDGMVVYECHAHGDNGLSNSYAE